MSTIARRRLVVIAAALTVCMAAAFLLLTSPAGATHYTCSHSRNWWREDGWMHRYVGFYQDLQQGHVHVVENRRISDGYTTLRYWHCTPN